MNTDESSELQVFPLSLLPDLCSSVFICGNCPEMLLVVKLASRFPLRTSSHSATLCSRFQPGMWLQPTKSPFSPDSGEKVADRPDEHVVTAHQESLLP